MHLEKRGMSEPDYEYKVVSSGEFSTGGIADRLELLISGVKDRDKQGYTYLYKLTLTADDLAHLVKVALARTAGAAHAVSNPW